MFRVSGSGFWGACKSVGFKVWAVEGFQKSPSASCAPNAVTPL